MIQPGEQLVNMGSTPPWVTRWISSEPSSMMVRSAVNEVSNTLAKPTRRRAATIWPSMSVPGLSPNSSAMDTDTAGACCTTTVLPGSASTRITSAT
ncbi:MAG: hypothetical protein P4L36_21590 [Holophaga sp.]|nr:hypothetical protein [Holophaga sp.]